MRGNCFGKMLSMTSFGESHGEAMGVIIDGLPPGLEISIEDLRQVLARRAPGKACTSDRREDDAPEILSGVFEGRSLGTPIAVIVRNTDQRSSDYEELKNVYRPGHADRTTEMKYGIRDYRGGGRSSGRETVSRVIAGYFASLVMPDLEVNTEIINLAGHSFNNESDFDIEKYLEKIKERGDSTGGQISATINNVPAGLGEPVFDKLKSDLAKAMLSIGGCVSFSYGLGETFAAMSGADVRGDLDNFGGIEGGISNGRQISIKLTFKPPATVGDHAKQGRHDPCIIPRALVVVESMIRFVLADHYLRQIAYEKFNQS